MYNRKFTVLNICWEFNIAIFIEVLFYYVKHFVRNLIHHDIINIILCRYIARLLLSFIYCTWNIDLRICIYYIKCVCIVCIFFIII